MLPAAASLGLAISAIIARFTRSSMLDVLGQDFVRTARAKGVADRAVVYKHALRNALIPVVAMAGTQFVYLIGGAVIIEEVFALPGMGRLVVNAIYQRDYTTIQGAVLLLTSGGRARQPGPRSPLPPDRPPDPVRVSGEPGGTRRGRRPRALRSGSFLVGGLIVAGLLVAALAAPWLAPYAPTAIFPGAEIAPPGPRFLLGTDEVGRDILSRVLHGTRVSLGVAIPSVALAVLAGTTLGVGLGYWGGAPDLLAMRLFDVLFAFPPILLAIALVAALGPSTVNLVLTIAVLTLPQFAVLARSATLALKPQDFVQAARALGASHGRILGAHVLPNITPTLAVQTSLSLSIVILVEAALSFLGLGTQPPAPSWGSMLSRGPPVHDHRPVAGPGAGAGHHARRARLQPAR